MSSDEMKLNGLETYDTIMKVDPIKRSTDAILSLTFHGTNILRANLPNYSKSSQVKDGSKSLSLSNSASVEFAKKLIEYGKRGLSNLDKAGELNSNLGYTAGFCSAMGIAYETLFRGKADLMLENSYRWFEHQFNAGRFFIMNNQVDESVFCLSSSLDSILSTINYMKCTNKSSKRKKWEARFIKIREYVDFVGQDVVSGEKNAFELQRMCTRVENKLHYTGF